jgi:hypothetical protein
LSESVSWFLLKDRCAEEELSNKKAVIPLGELRLQNDSRFPSLELSKQVHRVSLPCESGQGLSALGAPLALAFNLNYYKYASTLSTRSIEMSEKALDDRGIG